MDEWLEENWQTHVTSECAWIYVSHGRRDLCRNHVYITKADEKKVTLVAHQPSYSAVPPRFLEVDHKYKAYIWFLCGLHCLFFTILARLLSHYLVVISPWYSLLPASAGDAGDMDLNPGSGRSPGGSSGNPLQYSCLENPVDRGTWQATVHGVAESDTTKQLSTHAHYTVLLNEKQFDFKWEPGILGLLLFVAVYLAFVLILSCL